MGVIVEMCFRTDTNTSALLPLALKLALVQIRGQRQSLRVQHDILDVDAHRHDEFRFYSTWFKETRGRGPPELVWWLDSLREQPSRPKNTMTHGRWKKAACLSFSLMFLFQSSFVPLQFISFKSYSQKSNKLSSKKRHLWSFTGFHPSLRVSYSDAGEEGDSLGAWRACGLTMTWMTKSFWILVSCSRVLSVSSFPEKNQRWWAASMSSWACSCFFSWPMVSAMLALRRRSLPVESRTCREEEVNN